MNELHQQKYCYPEILTPIIHVASDHAMKNVIINEVHYISLI
mgnify:CR=1 FL=1